MTHYAKRKRAQRSTLQRIQATRQALLERLTSAERAPHAENRPIEPMEGVQEAVTKQIHAVSRHVLAVRLRALQQAEERIQQGTYGLCETCGEHIPPRRLEVVPEAQQCVVCAEAAEAGGIGWRPRRRAVLTAA